MREGKKGLSLRPGGRRRGCMMNDFKRRGGQREVPHRKAGNDGRLRSS